MSASHYEQKKKILSRFEKYIQTHAPKSLVDALAPFASHFYGSISADDLNTKSFEELYTLLSSLYGFVSQRVAHEVKLRIYNPNIEDHNWQSSHSIIELCSTDMPFMVDSIRMAINKLGLLVHLVIHTGHFYFERDAQGKLLHVLDPVEARDKGIQPEAIIYLEIDRISDQAIKDLLSESILRVIGDVESAVSNWKPMREVVQTCLNTLMDQPPPFDPNEVNEAKDFLSWLLGDHFTFLGSRDYRVIGDNDDKVMQLIPKSGLGVLKEDQHSQFNRNLAALPPKAREMMLASQILLIAKTNTISTVHRAAYTDYIGIKQFDEHGDLVGVRLIIGLYTSSAYNSNPRYIPFLRRKVTQVFERSKFNLDSHAGKALLHILETLPRDDLFQASSDELYDLSMGILHLQERQRTRLFVRRDSYNRYFSCLVFVPRERFNTHLRKRMQKILMDELKGLDSTFEVKLDESILARIHFVLRTDAKDVIQFDAEKLEQSLVAVTRSWQDDFKDQLIEAQGEAEGLCLFNKYAGAFSLAYQGNYTPQIALNDLKHIERINAHHQFELGFRQLQAEGKARFQLKIYRPGSPSPLSDVLPILENMGLRVLSEQPTRLFFAGDRCVWINDFHMEHVASEVTLAQEIKQNFIQAFTKIWFGKVNNDALNRLILEASLDWKKTTLLRAYANYLRQIGFTFSQEYIADALNKHPNIASQLVRLFEQKFNPQAVVDNEQQALAEQQVITALDQVESLDQDRILRRILALIKATLRTNYYIPEAQGEEKAYISLKFAPGEIPDIPLPAPMFEIFVYSAKVEGVHLRGAKVARGGLRWSDRREDYRTEVLGLMKAQQVKNAVIVPLGAKGGFIPKSLPQTGGREAVMTEVITCYQIFIKGLLDITDNIVNSKMITPEYVIRYDEPDPYLVVAADKGTATFSDIANAISQEYGFWLGDAFASGGSTGYDHKKMGITALGAWESTKRHFSEQGLDTQKTPFTVFGVGDMSGDVFGNGMLASKFIKLVAAFNHIHIFIDPNPDPATSYKERKRLFNLPRSTWLDYKQELISQGGGIFSRSQKSIQLTPEIQALLQLEQTEITPNGLIQAILKSSVDLFWSAGIGTFVKSSSETDLDVGDKINDPIRVDAKDLHCKVVVEGGNLGLTQLARIEFSKLGGKINTDFIDNSAGVDCSDHEVNIKILLNSAVKNGDLTEKQRNALLVEMTDEVATLVLRNNYLQTETLSLEEYCANKTTDLWARYIVMLEKKGRINRQLEYLPDEEEIKKRKALGVGFTRPELSVLMAYDKILLKEKILSSALPEDIHFHKMLHWAFPKQIGEQFEQYMLKHSLKREIIATQVSNFVANTMGINFVTRLNLETGAKTEDVVRAFITVQELFDLSDTWERIRSLDCRIDYAVKSKMVMQLYFLIRRTTRWFLHHFRSGFEIDKVVKKYSPALRSVSDDLLKLLNSSQQEYFYGIQKEYIDQGVPKKLATPVVKCSFLFQAMDIIKAAYECGHDAGLVAKYYYLLSEELELGWMRIKMFSHSVESSWDELARSSLLDELDLQQSRLTINILKNHVGQTFKKETYTTWKKNHADLFERWQNFLTDMRANDKSEFIMYSVMLRELLEFANASQ